MDSNSLPYPTRHPITLFATWFGCGLSPKAPGTVGSLAALPFAWIVLHIAGSTGLALLIVVFLATGLWVSEKSIPDPDDADPDHIVIDEVVGQWVAVLFTPPDLVYLLSGFCLFRLFDIIKPGPIGWIDKNIKGSPGIMLDDIAAGLCAMVSLLGLQSLWYHLFPMN